MFSGLRNASVFERGVFLQPGTYQLLINKCIVKETRKSGDGYIVEMTVQKSSNPAHPEGSKASWFQALRDKDVAFGALKEFIYATLGYRWPDDKETILAKVDPVIEELIDSSLPTEQGGENSFAGKSVCVQTFLKKTAGKGLDFTVHRWSPAL